MKKILTICLSLFTISVFAQPTILSTEMAAPGTEFYYKHAATFSIIDTSVQGANQTWNYSSLTHTTDPDYTVTIFNPSQTPYSAPFPTSNWGYLEGPDLYYDYFSLSSTKLERLGSYDATNLYTTYSNPQTEYVFPMAMGLTNTDTSVNSASITSTIYTFTCIGYGTIMVPGHTYTNTIMTHVHANFGFTIDQYLWYDSNNGMPVFIYVAPNIITPEAATYLYNTTSGINENNFALGIQFNNPVTSILNIKMLFANPVSISYNLLSSLGATIRSGTMENNSIQQLNLNIENEPAGLYFLSLRDVDQPEHSRLLKIIKQ